MVGRLFIFLLKAYQLGISAWRPRCCRFVPSCSQYAIEAISRYGIMRGSWRMIGRLLRCHPFCPGGLDPLN